MNLLLIQKCTKLGVIRVRVAHSLLRPLYYYSRSLIVFLELLFSKAVIDPGEDGAANAGIDKAISCPDDNAGISRAGLVTGID
jgi:hypothetical protein